jgi:Fe-S-cluster formation regulator IscX/YfhJ
VATSRRRGNQKKKGKTEVEEPAEAPAAELADNGALIRLISSSINALADEDGWVFLGDLGNLLLKKQPDFDPRNYGFKKLGPLIESLGKFEVNKESSGKGNIMHVYVRMK